MKTIDKNPYLTSVVKSKLQTTFTYTLGIKDRLDKAFDVIPRNSIINKGRCGIGGTFLETKAKRNSIIIVPTIAIIDDKCKDENNNLYPGYYVVLGKKKTFKYKELKAFIESDTPNKKIFSTPAGIQKIMNCGASSSDIYRDWFLLLDESHTAITDDFRADMLVPFRYLFDFDNAALISATPYRFSDKRFKTFDVHNITFDDKVGTVVILSTVNVLSVLYTKLLDPEKFPGRVHIFLNAITQIGSVINMAELTDVSIFCAISKKNKDKLNGLASFIKDKPKEANYSKINFYTSKYFEGWDLEDANATIIIVSDHTVSTLKSGVSNKCIQAAGRNRQLSNEIIHITNDKGINNRDSFEQIEIETFSRAESAIRGYNIHLNDSKNDITFTPDLEFGDLLMKYSSNHTRFVGASAILDNFKVDQIVNEECSAQEFNNITFIKDAWQNIGYKTLLKRTYAPPIPTSAILKNKTQRVEATIRYLEELELNNEEDFPKYRTLAKFLPIECESIRIAYYEIGPTIIRSLNGNMKAIRRLVLESQYERKKKLIAERYYKEAGQRKQSLAWITKTLERIYTELGVIEPSNSIDTIKIAKAAQLSKYFTKIMHCKMDKTNINGFYIETY